MPEFEEDSMRKRNGVGSEGADAMPEEMVPGGVTADRAKSQARYSLKRGRLPSVKNTATNGHVPNVKPMDVTHDAIGTRAEKVETPCQSPVKKSTEVVTDSNVPVTKKKSRESDTTIAKDSGKFTQQKAEKCCAREKLQNDDDCQPCKRSGVRRLFEKFLKVLGIKPKSGDNSRQPMKGAADKNHYRKRPGSNEKFGTNRYRDRANHMKKM
jgi:hypothetical protein